MSSLECPSCRHAVHPGMPACRHCGERLFVEHVPTFPRDATAVFHADYHGAPSRPAASTGTAT